MVRAISKIAEHVSPNNTHVVWWECEAITSELIAGSDLSEARWVHLSDVPTNCDPEAVGLWPEEIKEYFGLKSV